MIYIWLRGYQNTHQTIPEEIPAQALPDAL